MSRVQKSLVFVGIALAVFFLYRLALYFTYYDVFSSLKGVVACSAFLNGIRFDLSIMLTFFALPLLMMNLPIKHAKHKLWFGFWGLVLYLFVIVATLLLIGDIIYYAEVKRHMGRELLTLSNDFGYIVSMATGPYKFVLAIFLLYALGLFVLWIKILAIEKAPLSRPIIKFVLIIFVLFLGIRGTVDRKSINVIDAFETGDAAYGNLCLNGLFTTYHSLRKSKDINHRYFEEDKLYNILNLTKSDYPLSKRYKKEDKGYNLIFVLLESWDYDYVDSFGGSTLGLTPNFDSLVKDGVKFTKFYAAGQRSIEGIQGTLTGLPVLQGTPHLGSGLEVSNFSKLGSIAKNNGYKTIFAQSSRRRSFRIDAIARATGFDEFYGMEDMPILLDYPDPESAKFGWDYETYMLLKEKLKDIEKPFLAYMFTGTTHTEYVKLPNRFERYPHEPNGEGGYLNSLYYSDWSLGEFMKFAKAQSWFEKTIFIFSADHAGGYKKKENFIEKFRIPFLIYAPKILKPQIMARTGSQLDVLPTIIDLMGFGDEFSSIGESLFLERENLALVSGGEIMGLVDDKGYIAHTMKNRVEKGSFGETLPDEHFQGLENKLMALDQISFELVIANRWAR